MKEHGEEDKIIDGGQIRHRRRDRWDAVDKERELLTALCHGDISVVGVLIVNYIEIPPLRADGGLVNRFRGLRKEAITKDEAKQNRQNAEGLPEASLREVWPGPKEEYRKEDICR
jgi:hypothetical protein